MWTVEQVKRELPGVTVKIGKNLVPGRLSGRLNRFATVTVTNTVMGGQTPWRDWHFAWETIVHCLNSDEALLVD